MPFNEHKTLDNFSKLRHKDKKLDYKSYSECLKKYLDTSRSTNLVTIPDLQNTLRQIQNFLFEEAYHNINNSYVAESDLQDGEHITVFRLRTVLKHGTRVLVEKFNDHGIFVAQFVSSRIKTGWIFLNEADIQII